MFRDRNAPSKVATVFQFADDAFKKGVTFVEPDMECFELGLEAMSKRVNFQEVGELVDQILNVMKKDRYMIPTTKCYASAIAAWKNVAMGRECDDRELAAFRTHDLLQEMVRAYHQTTIVKIQPSTQNYNDALEALTMSKNRRAFQRAETLLKTLEENLDLADEEIRDDDGMVDDDSESPVELFPTADSYKHALTVLKNSGSHNKVREGLLLVQRLESHIDHLRKVSTEKALVDAMSEFIAVCAREVSKHERQNMETMFTALRTMEGIRALSLTPNAETYASLLEACDTLVHSSQDRLRILENIFERACTEGYVDHAVLGNFKKAATTYLYGKLVVAPSEVVENVKVVPESWTRNVEGFSTNMQGGRKVLPLSIEGQFTFTKAAAEHKMRRLRKQANKRMLEGGRLRRRRK